MIKTKKPNVIPSKLLDDGMYTTVINCLEYEVNSTMYKANLKADFYINPAIYNHPTIKKELRKAQKNKCCFCEKEQADEYGAVEHFRPKNGFKSKRGEKLNKPGYYWLGYDWENLYFVCSPCNTRKGNLFPLVDESKRAKNHRMDFQKENCLLIEPKGILNPRDHIIFENEFPKGITDYGRRTIEICGLDRAGLNKKRRKLLDQIDDKIAIVYSSDQNSISIVERAKQFLKNCQKYDAEFSATAIDYLKQFNIQTAS